MKIFLQTLLFLLLLVHTHTAQLPAVRPRRDNKRVLASRLLKRANGYKDSSLRDVLGENLAINSELNSSQRARERAQRRQQAEHPKKEKETQHQNFHFHSVSDLFAWAITHSSVTRRNVSAATIISDSDIHQASKSRTIKVDMKAKTTRKLNKGAKLKHNIRNRKALPSSSRTTGRAKGRDEKRWKPQKAGEGLGDAEVSESNLLRHSIGVLSEQPLRTRAAVDALRVVEELCHSIDNGRDVSEWGGMGAVVSALNASGEAVRAGAAWAVATCCQNNPAVQRGALIAGAVPRLARLVVEDQGKGVRGKALFGLNALLEMEEARVEFEGLSTAVHVVRVGLEDGDDVRAIRRALNLAELLVQKNLDSWKTQFEAWDVMVIVERLMRTHEDFDVRESAARMIAAMDGKSIS